jgi:hypothetical protein
MSDIVSWREVRDQLLAQEPLALPAKTPHWDAIKPVEKVDEQPPLVIIDGLWRREEVLLLGGHAKSWKSWAQMDLMFCIANNLGWLVWPKTNGGKVLHIDCELFATEIKRRYELIAESYGTGDLKNIEILSLRGESFQLSDFTELAEHISPDKYSAVSFDPTYRLLAGAGLSESDAGVIIDIMNRSLQIAKKLKTGVDLLQHFSKGNQSDKRAIDAFSGSGVWGRAPDACLAFREHNDEKCYTVHVDLRHWPPIESFVVEFDYPRFHVQDSKDPENLKRHKPGRPTNGFTIDSLCDLIESDEYISYSSLFRRSHPSGVSKRTFLRRLKEAKHKGYLATNPADSTYFLTHSFVSKFRINENNSDQARNQS